MKNKSKVENGEVIEDYKSAFIVSDEAQTHLSYPCYVSAFQDECFQDFITNALNQQRISVLEEFWEEINRDLYCSQDEAVIVTALKKLEKTT